MNRTFKERYALLKNRQAKDWWTATFADPVSWFILALCGDCRQITPNRITIVSFLLKIIPALLLVIPGHIHPVTAAVLLQIGQVFDSMDGNLARYRRQPSETGGFLDRTLDGAGFLAVMTALSWYTYASGHPAWILLTGPFCSGLYLLISYMYWSTAYAHLKYKTAAARMRPPSNVRDISDVPLWQYILRAQPRIIRVNQADFYFWISLFLVIGRPAWALWFLTAANCIKVIERFAMRYRSLRKLERKHLS